MKYLLSIYIFLLSGSSTAQNNFVGDWTGKIDAGTQKIEVILHITSTDQLIFDATWDVPMQGANGLSSKSVVVASSKISIVLKDIPASYEGTLNTDGQSISGTWTQNGRQGALVFNRIGKNTTIETLKRPQTPNPPFSYNSEEIIYKGKTTGLNYGATFTYPKKGKAFKTVILITGSGPQDRDETILGHKAFAVIADYFTKKGTAVLRIDDRGVGKSTGDFNKSTSLDFANDVEEHINYLKGRSEVDPSKIGLCGHSEGGLIAPIVAARNKNVAFIISMAGPAEPIKSLMIDQTQNVLRSQGMTEPMVEAYGKLYDALVAANSTAKDSMEATQNLNLAVDQWKTETDNAIVLFTTGIKDQKTQDNFIAEYVSTLRKPWFSFFINYDPKSAIENTTCPILAINGEKDIQVGSKSNIKVWNQIHENNIAKGKKQIIITKEYKGMNHLFQKCKTCSAEEYGTIENTIEKDVLKAMVKFIKSIN
jgi:uncharacterized protein